MSAFPLEGEVEYPSSDGKPMAETDLHRKEMVYVTEALAAHFRDSPDVYVSGNILLYYVEGDPRSSISPDALVTRGLAHAKEERDVYKVWEEGEPPCWVMEVTSKKTRTEDLTRKRKLYKQLGVEEYFLFDPRAEYLNPPLQGFRLGGRDYRPITPEPDGSIFSPALGLGFRVGDQGRLQIQDPKTGTVLLRPEELEAARRAAMEQARQAQKQAQEAKENAARLEQEITRLRQELERRQG
ncbi:MAG TPA: Uma2 family endonuclease [Thermoanaerobaculia bacterium]|nr:Uma2 family endonuclease [Thermoanaerobaculia bacterium]